MIGNNPAFCSSLVMAPQLVAATGVQQKLILRAIDHLASTCGVELPVPRRCVRRVRVRLSTPLRSRHRARADCSVEDGAVIG
jgi:hypothetical protein